MSETKEQNQNQFVNKDLHYFDNTKLKEQIRTELINELLDFEKNDVVLDIFAKDVFRAKLRSLLPTETPEKIAERKAEEMYGRIGNKNSPIDVIEIIKEALLTDIKK